VTSLEELAEAVHAGRMSNRPAVIDVPIDPREYQVHAEPPKMV
jgi:thiamine pyrophosphate-dependent acetolactate synthase large subunit-like protein